MTMFHKQNHYCSNEWGKSYWTKQKCFVPFTIAQKKCIAYTRLRVIEPMNPPPHFYNIFMWILIIESMIKARIFLCFFMYTININMQTLKSVLKSCELIRFFVCVSFMRIRILNSKIKAHMFIHFFPYSTSMHLKIIESIIKPTRSFDFLCMHHTLLPICFSNVCATLHT